VGLSVPTSTFADTAPSARMAGPDVVRAVALIGVVVMNFHGYLILRDIESGGVHAPTGWLDELFDPWDGPLSTRFAATFVLVAGVGVTLLTRRVVGDPARVREMRWRLVRRGVLLYVVGLLLEQIWPGTIIVYYGAMFVLAAGIFTWRSRWIVAAGVITAISSTALRSWRFDRARDGESTSWLTSPGDDSIRRYVFDVFVNGTHPLLPWFSFLCAGIVLGRILPLRWWRRATVSAGLASVSVAWFLSVLLASDGDDGDDGDLAGVVFSTNPLDRSIVYVTSALGTALLAYAAIDWLAERFPVATDPLRRAGQLTLSLYLAHVLVFNLLVDWLGWVEPAGTTSALLFAAGFWVAAIALAAWWQRRFVRGPAEYVYRAFGG
jgi:uncharacterized membrane protein YeiB